MVDHQYHGPATVPSTPSLQYQPSASVPQVDRMYVPTVPAGQLLAGHQTGPPDPADSRRSRQPDRPDRHNRTDKRPVCFGQPVRTTESYELTLLNMGTTIHHYSNTRGTPTVHHLISRPLSMLVSSVDRPVPLNSSTSYGAFGAGFPAYGAQGPSSKCDARSVRPVYSLFEQTRGTGPFVTPVTAVQPPPPTTISSVLPVGSPQPAIGMSAPRTPRS